jgi:arylsulfatase I/J
MLYVDDWGYANAGYHSPQANKTGEIRTPTIDGLVAAGVQFSRMYAYPFCSPSRCSLLSGRMPHHVSTQNIRGATYDDTAPQVGGQGIPRNMTTFSQILKRQNYSTHFVGKWDVGFATAGHTPSGRGFDTSLGYFFQINDYFTQGMSGSEGSACNKLLNTTKVKDLKDLWLDTGPATALAGSAYEEVLFEAQLMQVLHDYNASHTHSPAPTDESNDSATSQTHFSKPADVPNSLVDPSTNPLFIYYAPHLVHSPYQIPAAWLHKFDFIQQSDAGDTGGLRQVYTAMVSYMDTVIST